MTTSSPEKSVAPEKPSDQAIPAISRADTIRGLIQDKTQLAGIVFVVVILGIIFDVKNPVFLSFANVVELAQSGALTFIVASASTIVLVSGGIDFSVGAVFAAGGVVAGLLMIHGMPWPLAIILGIASGVLIGIINAAATIYLKVPPLIATLGTYFSVTGIITLMTGGNAVFGFPNAFNAIGQDDLFSVPYLVYIAVVVGAVFWLLLEKTPLGYNSRAVGGNRGAASANGIRVRRHDLIVYGLSGGIAAMAGILSASWLSAADPAAGGSTLTFQVLTAVIIGGTSLFGGIGSIGGTALGALLFAEINNGLVIVNVNSLAQNVFVGFILVLAVALDQARRARRYKYRR